MSSASKPDSTPAVVSDKPASTPDVVSDKPASTPAVIGDVKAQILVLQANIAALQAKGKLTENVNQMMKDLIAVFENKPPPTKVPPTFRITPSLPTAKMYNAYCDYIGPTLTHLMIRDGDSVIVYGSVEDSEVLIGYNTRTRMGGRFPANVVGLADTQPEIDYDLVVCITKRTSKASLDKLTYEMGDYVRLCRWENSNRDGYGLNQRTLNFGTFQMCEMRKIPW